MAIIPDKVAQFVADVDIAHAIIHGPASGAGSMVDTDGGPVRTLARAVAEGGATAAELEALRAAVESLSTADLSDWDAATADFLTAAGLPAAPVTSVAGRGGDVVLQTSDLSDWGAATAEFGGGGGSTPRPGDGPGSIPAADYFYQSPELDTVAYRAAGGAPRFAGATPWVVHGQLPLDVIYQHKGALVMSGAEAISRGGWEILGVEQAVDADPWKRRVSIDAFADSGGYGTGMYVVGTSGRVWLFTIDKSASQFILFAKSSRDANNMTTINGVRAFDPGSLTLEIEWTGTQYVFRYGPQAYYGSEFMEEYARVSVDYYGIGAPETVGFSVTGAARVAWRAFDGD